MLSRIAKIADSHNVNGRHISDLPFLWSLVDNPPTHPRISWNYLVTKLPLLLTRFRQFCPATGEPMYDEVREALNEKRILVSCCIAYGEATASMQIVAPHTVCGMFDFRSVGASTCRSVLADHAAPSNSRSRTQRDGPGW